MADTQKLPRSASVVPVKSASRIRDLRSNKRWQHTLRLMLSYGVLIFGALLVIFPLVWMLSASLKPPWQIFSNPIIWIPQKWEEVQAGNTNQTVNLWTVQHSGQDQKVIALGTRRYTNVIDAAKLQSLKTVPADQLGKAAATAVTINGETLTLNVRPWTVNGSSTSVVALAKSGDDTIIATLDELRDAVLRLPLDVVNGGERDTVQIGDVELRTRAITTDNAKKQFFPIGPESELTIVTPPELLTQVGFVSANQLTDAGYATLGQTELHLSKVNGDPQNYVVISSATWQPVINEEDVNTDAFTADSGRLNDQKTTAVQGIQLPTALYTPPSGAPYPVLILLGGTTQSLVIPLDKANSVRLARIEDLSTVHGDTLKDTPVRLQDGYSERGEVHNVMIVSEPRDMAMIVPQSAVSEAFDVNPATMQRAMHAELRFQGYKEALTTKVGETYFTTFFRNSFVLVFLNTLGHLISCVVVAYAFARLRAPGKSFLFLILLSTMMLPFPVTLVPVYEIFRDAQMVNTLWPLFLRSFFGNAFLIFMLRQFFSSIPRELEEAARIDGASILQIIWRIILPLSKPAIATVVIFSFWWTWNSFLEPFIYLSSPELFPVSLGLNFFQDQYGTIFYDRMIAASVLSMLPMLLIFFFAQRYFIEGIQLTGMKG